MSRCKVCKADFTKRSMTHKCCSPECAEQYAATERKRKELKEYRQRKEAIKPRRDWLKHAERVCNEYIRLRDHNRPCISCGATGGNHHAGHFRSVGSSPQLRYCEDNIHGQCPKCNVFLGGNLLGYRRGILERISEDALRLLEENNEPAKWSVDQLKEIIEYYRDKIKELKQCN